MTSPRVIAALDLGTNTIKLTVARCGGDCWEELHSAAEVVRIGKGIETDGRIAPDAIDRAVRCLIEFERTARELGADVFLGIATQALRVARNGSELMARAAGETAWDLRIISGDEEARLTFEGLRDSLPEQGAGLIVDIGGGSTEFVLADNRKWLDAESHPVGSGMLTDRHVNRDPPLLRELAQARRTSDDVLANTRLAGTGRIDDLLLAGGTGQFIDALSRRLYRRPLSLVTLPELVNALTTIPAQDLGQILAIPTERAHVLPAGHQVAMSAVALFQPRAIRAVPSGIRAGLIARWCCSESAEKSA